MLFSKPFFHRSLIDFRALKTLKVVLSSTRNAHFREIAVSRMSFKNDSKMLEKSIPNQQNLDKKPIHKHIK